MFPIRDNIPAQRTPVVNYTIIGLCSIVFLMQLQQSSETSLVERYGMVPARVTNPDTEVVVVHPVPVRTPFGIQIVEAPRPLPPQAVPPWQTMLTCIFLHGGWMHFLGNMWFLYIFGDNVEDRMGHFGYAAFYLISGVGASAAHVLVGPSSIVPTIGASGAIAGVMGAYMLLYPRAMVLAVIPIFVFLHTIVLPAPFFLGVWFLMQFFQGTMSITSVDGGGVAWWAHIGGFAVGFAIAWFLKSQDVTRPAVIVRRPNTDRVRYMRYRPPRS